MTTTEERINAIYAGVEGLNAGDCIRTNSGLYMNVFEPTMDMICIEDIAHALSKQCRFGGHLSEFYSVAQHCIEAAKRVKILSQQRDSEWGEVVCTKLIELETLMHDGSEAYLLDFPTPIKRGFPDYKILENKLMRKIALKYGFTWPMRDIVKEVDAEMLVFEWECMVIKSKPLPEGFKIMTQEEAKAAFLEYFYSL